MATINLLTKEVGTNKQLAQPAIFTLPIDYSAIPIIGVQTPTPTDPTKITNYKFRFWTIGNTFQIDSRIQISTQEDITATAWYVTAGNGKKTYALGFAFSLDTGEFLVKENPFATVNPSDGWTPTKSWVETTNHDVVITAKDTIQNQGFVEWFSNKPGATTTSGSSVTVPAGNHVYLVAKYGTALLNFEPVKARKIPIPGEDSEGIPAMRWLDSRRIAELIEKFRLRPMSDDERKIYSTKAPTVFRCAIDVPHLHHDGKTYLLKQEQWKTLSNRIQGELNKELANAKSISFDEALKISKAIKTMKKMETQK
jgi:hypothetical protein